MEFCAEETGLIMCSLASIANKSLQCRLVALKNTEKLKFVEAIWKNIMTVAEIKLPTGISQRCEADRIQVVRDIVQEFQWKLL